MLEAVSAGFTASLPPRTWMQRTRRAAVAITAVWLLLPLIPDTAQGASVTYEHDAHGRLQKATHSDGTIVEYAYDANGNRVGATVTSAPVDTTPPSTPGTPTFSNIATTSATASWTAATDDVGVTGYEYRVNSGNWQLLANVLSVGLTNLSGATTHTFQVRARDAAGNVGSASSGTFTTPDTVPPSVPTGLQASSPTSTRVNLSWTASTDNVAVTGYRIFRNGSQIATRSTTSYSDTAVTGTTTYSYTVSAYDAAGNTSARSSAVSITTPDTIAPSTPTGLGATAVSDTRVNLSWNAASDTGGSGLAGYRIYRNGSQISTRPTTSYSDTTAAAGTSYSYTVRAYDGAGNVSGHSNAASVTTLLPLRATVNRTSWFGPGSPDVVVTPSGGSGGYTYAWQRVSGDTGTIVFRPTSNATVWSRPGMDYFVSYTSVWRCRVTDSAGNVTYAPNVTVTFYMEDGH